MITLTVNGFEVQVPEGSTILEAAKAAEIKIPTLCKHPDLPPMAACGLCVVKVEGMPELVRACSTPARPGMQVQTHDPEIVGVRKTLLELILSAHPNECLTCGRHGACELQELAKDFGIREAPFPSVRRELPRDDSTGCITLDPRKCIKCGRCLEICQQQQDVWALSFMERGLNTRIAPAGDITLAESPCVHCGQCSAHCPVGAILEFDQTEAVWEALRDPTRHCVVQIAPSVRVSLGEAFGYEPGANLAGQLYHALRRMGFDTVFDTNFGADVTIMEEASELAERIRSAPEKLPLITTCCPSWVDFMEKFHADMIDHFSTCKSPHAILGTLTKTYYAAKEGIDPDSIFMVSIMPCTAKKYEITREASMYASGGQDVDISLTTRELTRMIRQTGIALENLNCLELPDSPLGEYSGAGVIFGVSGGVMESALRSAHYFLTGEDRAELEFEPLHGLDGIKEMTVNLGGHDLRVAVAHGLGHVEEVLERVRQAKLKGEPMPYDFIEVMACPGGCIGGGGQSWNVSNAVREQRAAGLLKEDRVQEVRTSYANPWIQKLYSDFLGEPLSEKARDLLHTRYQPRPEYLR
jgi:NADP-reducing hydrogenase subunit HndD